MYNINKITRLYIEALEGLIEIETAYYGKAESIIRGRRIENVVFDENELQSRFMDIPAKHEIITHNGDFVIRILPLKTGREKNIPWTNIILFAITFFSTVAAGILSFGAAHFETLDSMLTQPWKAFLSGLPFSIPLLAILLFHEFGHYIASKIHKVKVTLPYFIPAPTIIGTMGAVIRTKSPFITRKQLFDVGAAGPLAGMLVALPVLAYGLANPILVHEATLEISTNLGESLLFQLIAFIVQPDIPAGMIPALSAPAFAGWVGLFVTMLNLLPIGQLDGGHILYAMFGRFQHKIAYLAIAVLVGLSFFWIGWIIWAIFGLILIKPKHPPTVLDEIEIDGKRKIVGIVCIILFIVCFIPVPFSVIY